MLVGNKSDLQSKREVAKEEAELFRKKFMLEDYIEISCKNGTSIQKLFETAAEQYIKFFPLEVTASKIPHSSDFPIISEHSNGNCILQ